MTLLDVHGLNVNHGQLQAVRDFDLTMDEGETVAIIGANGAGKSTLLGALAGLLKPASGTISLGGTHITRLPAYRHVAAGIALVPEGRRLFKSLTVEENLRTGLYRARKGPWNVQRVMEIFDWMPERRGQNASQLSGGEQQAVAIGRALVGNPRLLLIDELSLGLAPVVIQRMYRILPRIIEEGTSRAHSGTGRLPGAARRRPGPVPARGVHGAGRPAAGFHDATDRRRLFRHRRRTRAGSMTWTS